MLNCRAALRKFGKAQGEPSSPGACQKVSPVLGMGLLSILAVPSHRPAEPVNAGQLGKGASFSVLVLLPFKLQVKSHLLMSSY